MTDDSLERRVLELHESGLSRRDIAEQAETSTWTVSQIVHAAGRSFPRSEAAQAASDARANKLALKRIDQANALLEQAQAAMESVRESYDGRSRQPGSERALSGTAGIGAIVEKAMFLVRKL